MLTHVGTQTIETARLLLRPFTYTDGESMLKNWVADERVQFMYAEPVYITEEAVKGLLDKYIGAYEKTDTYNRWLARYRRGLRKIFCGTRRQDSLHLPQRRKQLMDPY